MEHPNNAGPATLKWRAIGFTALATRQHREQPAFFFIIASHQGRSPNLFNPQFSFNMFAHGESLMHAGRDTSFQDVQTLKARSPSCYHS